MNLSPTSIEELKLFGTPIEELIKENPSFEELNSKNSILISVEDLISKKAFVKLEETQNIFTPINN